MKSIVTGVAAVVCSVLVVGTVQGQAQHQNALLDLWTQGKPGFGVYAPSENATPRGPEAPATPVGAPSRLQQRPPMPPPRYTREGGEKLATNPLYDYVFLNLEEHYDPAAVAAMAAGLRSPRAVGRKTLIVRIPSIEVDGPQATRARVKEILDAGGDGVTIPHIRNLDEARLALSFFGDAKANVWSPSNPTGETIAMLMLEDPRAVEQAREVADLQGLSILACGIGSLRQALGGDRAGAEAGTQKVLAETKRARLANMLTANAQDIEQRIREGFLALLMQGPTSDDTIRIGRAAVGR